MGKSARRGQRDAEMCVLQPPAQTATCSTSFNPSLAAGGDRPRMPWCDWGFGTHRDMPRSSLRRARPHRSPAGSQPVQPAQPSSHPQWPGPRSGSAAAGWHRRRRAHACAAQHWPVAAQERGACCKVPCNSSQPPPWPPPLIGCHPAVTPSRSFTRDPPFAQSGPS